jgi:hypothetical protein
VFVGFNFSDRLFIPLLGDFQAVLEPLLITLDYQQRVICSGSEIVADSSFKTLQMTFSVAVIFPPIISLTDHAVGSSYRHFWLA